MTITFTDAKSGESVVSSYLGIKIERVIIGQPEIVSSYVDVPGADGQLDYTEFFGRTTYRNRYITIECGYRITSRFDQESQIRNALHGRRMKIFLSEDAQFYYIGRLSVGPIEKKTSIAHFTIEANCHPYKFKASVTEVTSNLTTSYKTISLTNLSRPAFPSVTVSRETTLQIAGTTTTISAGTHQLLSLELPAGTTTVQAKTTASTGTIKFSYQEASL